MITISNTADSIPATARSQFGNFLHLPFTGSRQLSGLRHVPKFTITTRDVDSSSWETTLISSRGVSCGSIQLLLQNGHNFTKAILGVHDDSESRLLLSQLNEEAEQSGSQP